MDENDKIITRSGEDSTDAAADRDAQKPADSGASAPPDHDASTDKNNTITLEIVRHGKLFNLLKSPRDLWKMFYFLFALVIVTVMSIGIAVVILKQFLPYNTITTSLYGNTTLRSEDKDVTYWLFNTAELWANSGIEVKKGDVLTIRASGASHTAIHHLALNARSNKELRTKWTDTGGSPENTELLKTQLHRASRIAPEENQGVLLMQVVPSKEKIHEHQDYLDGSNNDPDGGIYVIGKERQNLVIRRDGTLYFTVNDAVLTDSVIKRMYLDNIERINAKVNSSLRIDSSLANEVLKTEMFDSAIAVLGNNNIAIRLPEYRTYADVAREIYDFDPYPGIDSICNAPLDSLPHPLLNEILYYKHKKFRDAWFVDNLGSFLIVIERAKH